MSMGTWMLHKDDEPDTGLVTDVKLNKSKINSAGLQPVIAE